jgi:hypothetical protein
MEVRGTPKMFRRRQYLINPKFQVTLIAFFTVLAVIAIVVFYAENLFLFSKFSGGGEAEDALNDPVIMEIIQEEQDRMRVIFSVTSLAVLFIMTFGGLVLSNRVAGPLYRMERHIRDIINGETKRKLRFREHDFFPELAEIYNEMLLKKGVITDEPFVPPAVEKSAGSGLKS